MNFEIIKKQLEPFKLFIYFYILIFPLDLTNWMMSALSITLLIWWLAIGKQKGYFIKLKEILYNKSLLLFISFILYAYLTFLWTDNTSQRYLHLYKYYWIMIPVIFTTLDKKDVKFAFYALIFSFALYAIYSLLIFLGLFSFEYSNSLNPKGHIPYSTVTAYFTIATIFSYYFYLREENRKLRYLLLFTTFLSFFALVLNNGRIGQLSFLGTIIILFFYYRKDLYKYKKSIAIFFIIAILGIFYLYSSNKIDRYKKGFDELVYSYQNKEFVGSWGPRLFMWYVAAEAIPKNLIFGAGGDYYDDIREYIKKNPTQLKHPTIGYHNQHLDYLAKYGIFGYTICLLGVLILLRQLYIRDKEYYVVGVIFFSIVFINSLGNENLTGKPFNTTYALVFILLAIMANGKNKKINSN